MLKARVHTFSAEESKAEPYITVSHIVNNFSLRFHRIVMDPPDSLCELPRGVVNGEFHSHHNWQMITYLISGLIQREGVVYDSSHHVLMGGMLDYTLFTSGVGHNEILLSDTLELFRIWVPCFVEYSYGISKSLVFDEYDIPVIREEDNSAELRVLSGSIFEIEGPLQTNPPISFFDLSLKLTSSTPGIYSLILDKEYKQIFLYVWRSSSRTSPTVLLFSNDNNEVTNLHLGTTAALSHFGNTLNLQLSGSTNSCRLLILAVDFEVNEFECLSCSQHLPNSPSHYGEQLSIDLSPVTSTNLSPFRTHIETNIRDRNKCVNLCFI